MTDYCTLIDIQQSGRLDIVGTQYDAALGSLINVCSRWIDDYCRMPQDGFAATASGTHYFGRDEVDGNVLLLDEPLVSIATLVNGDGSTLDAAAYRLYPRNTSPKWGVELRSGYAWQWSLDGEIAVTGVWGASATVPAPVAEACRMLVAWMFKRYQAGLQDVTATPEIGQLIYAESIPKQVKALLAPYKRVLL